jgi:hypothetical protein
MKEKYPFELHAHGSTGGFIIFEINESVALPLMALTQATLRGTSTQQSIVLEFESHVVMIDGAGLDDFFGHLLTGKIRLMRRGAHEHCTIEKIHLTHA